MRLLVPILAVVLLVPAAEAKIPPPPLEAAVVPTGRAPCGLAARGDELWVAVYEVGAVLRLDRRGRVQRRFRVGPWACRVTVARGAVWVTRDRASELIRVDLRTGQVRRFEVAAEPFDVLHAAGSLWVSSHATGTVSRLDPATGHLRGRVDVGADPAGLAACGGRVWVGHGGDAEWITSIEPVTLETQRISVVAAAPGWPHCIHGRLWVVTPDAVIRIDARTGRLLTHLQIGATLADAAAAPDGLVWVTDKQHSLAHRVTRDGRFMVDSFPAGPGAFALARVGNSMWVTSFAGSDVRRFDP